MSDQCYYPLDQFPTLPDKYIQEAQEANYHFKVSYWNKDANAWRAETSFAKTEFMTALTQQYQHNELKPNPCYLKNGPMQGYEWHVDKLRTCVINWVLTPNDPAYVIFRKKINSFFFDIMGPVPYVVGRPFVFNPKIEHSVFNLTNQDRLIMSVGLFGPSYEEVKDFLLSLPPMDHQYNFVK
jgi:hypothetical protein